MRRLRNTGKASLCLTRQCCNLNQLPVCFISKAENSKNGPKEHKETRPPLDNSTYLALPDFGSCEAIFKYVLPFCVNFFVFYLFWSRCLYFMLG
jgi:hypothetical protein